MSKSLKCWKSFFNRVFDLFDLLPNHDNLINTTVKIFYNRQWADADNVKRVFLQNDKIFTDSSIITSNNH